MISIAPDSPPAITAFPDRNVVKKKEEKARKKEEFGYTRMLGRVFLPRKQKRALLHLRQRVHLPQQSFPGAISFFPQNSLLDDEWYRMNQRDYNRERDERLRKVQGGFSRFFFFFFFFFLCFLFFFPLILDVQSLRNRTGFLWTREK
jgi:hypothetical protein